jgi:outer membrane immunogenic protein
VLAKVNNWAGRDRFNYGLNRTHRRFNVVLNMRGNTVTFNFRKITSAIPALVVGLVLATAQPANAAPKWQGAYLGVQAGAGIMITDVSGEIFSVGGTDPISLAAMITEQNGLGDAGLIYGGQIGYDHMLGKKFLVGVQLSGSWGTLKANSTNIVQTVSNDIVISGSELEVENTSRYAASLRAGALVNPNTLLYAIGGYSRGKFEAAFSAVIAGTDLPASTGGSASVNENISGWHAGFGLETKLTDNVSLSIEYRFNKYDTASIIEQFNVGDASAVYVNSDITPTVHTATLGLNYKF